MEEETTAETTEAMQVSSGDLSEADSTEVTRKQEEKTRQVQIESRQGEWSGEGVREGHINARFPKGRSRDSEAPGGQAGGQKAFLSGHDGRRVSLCLQ